MTVQYLRTIICITAFSCSNKWEDFCIYSHTNRLIFIQEDTNILQGLNSEDFTKVRGLLIDMILATDMSCHFEHLTEMKSLLSTSNA